MAIQPTRFIRLPEPIHFMLTWSVETLMRKPAPTGPKYPETKTIKPSPPPGPRPSPAPTPKTGKGERG